MLTWPHAHSDWAIQLPALDALYVTLVRHITPVQKAYIICFDTEHQTHVQNCLKQVEVNPQNCRYIIIPTNDTWVRDYAPIGIKTARDSIQFLNFQFNAWGRKYPADLDNAVNAQLPYAQHNLCTINWILEGGAIDSDGQGGLLTTQSYWQQRYPKMRLSEIKQKLQQYLGITHVHYLKHGCLIGDDTDGHIDMLARFCSPSCIAYVHCADQTDPHYPSLHALHLELKHLRQRHGAAYQLVSLPLPSPCFNAEGKRLPASYVNFLIINQRLLVPTYAVKEDKIALMRLQQIFPAHQVIGIDCRLLIQQYGSLHCAAMNIISNH